MKRRPTTVFAAIRDTLRENKIAKQKQRVDDAIKVRARAASEKEYHRVMADFYTERAAGVDPHQDWWEFAAAKEKETEHVAECQAYGARADEAAAQVVAEKARYVQLLNGHGGTGQGSAS